MSLRVGDLDDSSLISREVTCHRPRLVASPGYVARIDAPLHPGALTAHVRVAFSRWERPLHWTMTCGADTVRFSPEPRLVINDYAGVLQALLDGCGISETPSFICAPHLASGRLIEAMPAWGFASTAVSLVWPSGRNLPPLVRVFKDFCVVYFDEKPLASQT